MGGSIGVMVRGMQRLPYCVLAMRTAAMGEELPLLGVEGHQELRNRLTRTGSVLLALEAIPKGPQRCRVGLSLPKRHSTNLATIRHPIDLLVVFWLPPLWLMEQRQDVVGHRFDTLAVELAQNTEEGFVFMRHRVASRSHDG